MAALTWLLTFICAAGSHLSSASPVLRSAPEVQAGQNVSLSCNLTSTEEITWFLLRSEQLLPLLTVAESKLPGNVVSFHSRNPRLSWERDEQTGLVGLNLQEVEEEDVGLYFCTSRLDGDVLANGGILLTVNGADGESSRIKRPCWSLGICVLPGLFTFSFVCMLGFYLCSGKPAGCCCNPERRDASLRTTEEESLHYLQSEASHTSPAPLAGQSPDWSKRM
ncbi:uncharacterized protein LOC110969447 [Acanthochromis polyacanthus]|uniref:uncharacterized protein LOC110969447 n=1 Tax=Acanthochromis polyacanthus TaxID=80966 RepID=UPI002234C76F|nr:uncharacterized protein LOC110969447 [Acanthochromis polyacanthus]